MAVSLLQRVIVTAVACSGPLCAQEAASAKTILDRSVAAIGGKARLQAITSRMMTGEMEYTGVGQRGSGAPITMVWVAPDKLHQTIQAPFGQIERTVVGRRGWGRHPQNGRRDLTSEEVAEARRDSALYNPAIWIHEYRELVSEGRKQVDGVSVDVLRGTLPDGRIERLYFSSEGHLPLRVDMWEEGPEAERTPGESYLARFFLSDYKATDGIMVPYTIRRERPNSVAIYRWKTVRHNVDIDAAVFSEAK
jgi:hypothetical protein